MVIFINGTHTHTVTWEIPGDWLSVYWRLAIPPSGFPDFGTWGAEKNSPVTQRGL